MQIVRAEGGKTYGISSRFNAATTDGSFLVASFTRNAEIVATLKLVQRELGRMHEKPPTAEEIKAAKGRIVGGYAMVDVESEAQAREIAGQFMELHRVHWPSFDCECEVRALDGA